jgi:peptide subunit release factor 1 (eRF1)
MRLQQEDALTIRRLRRLAKGRLVLSVYLQTEPGLALHHGHVAKLMDVLRDLRRDASQESQASLERETERVLSFVREDYVPTGRTLILFSSRPRRIFEALSLQLPLRTLARFAPRPYLTPLDLALEDHPRIAVALVSEEKAKILTTVLDEVESEEAVKGHVPGRQRQGGWSAAKYQRDREHHIHEHFVRVVRQLNQLQKRLPFKWLVVGGADDASSAVVNLLPDSLREKLAGTFREEQFETVAKIAAHAMSVAEQAERGEELRLSEQIRDRALAGGLGTLGWDETMGALGEGRVHELALAASEAASAEADRALRLASDSDALVEVIHGVAEEILAPYRGIGALLRY